MLTFELLQYTEYTYGLLCTFDWFNTNIIYPLCTDRFSLYKHSVYVSSLHMFERQAEIDIP